MAKTTLSDSHSNLCRDYSSFIKWAINKISKNTDKWTDYTVSEPDTLMLSSIAAMHDYAQYIIDQMYLDTDIDVCTTRFLHQVSAAMGQYLAGTNMIKIPIMIKNESSEDVTINSFEIFIHENELFTNPNSITIPANSVTESFVTRNAVNEMIYKINKNSNGEFFLNGSVETGSIIIYGVNENGNQILLNSCDYIFDLLYDKDTYRYLISSIDNNVLRIKVSPLVLTDFTAILVKYTTVDDYPVKEFLQLNLLSEQYKNLQVTTTSNTTITSKIPINTEKLTYLNSLTNIRTLCNRIYNLNLGELARRIDNYRLSYEPNSNRTVIPKFEYTTRDNRPLNGESGYPQVSSVNYFKSLGLNNKVLTIVFDSIPTYDLIVTYNENTRIVITNDILQQSLLNTSNLYITLQDYDKSSDIFIGFKNLGNFIKYVNNPIIYNMEILATEKSILLNKFTNNILLFNEYPEIKFLIPYILDLSSNIVLKQDINQLSLMTKITTLLYNTLINGEIISDIKGSYRRLELLIKNNIPEISDIKFTAIKDDQQMYVVSPDQHLVIDSPENYLNSNTINFSTEGDES